MAGAYDYGDDTQYAQGRGRPTTQRTPHTTPDPASPPAEFWEKNDSFPSADSSHNDSPTLAYHESPSSPHHLPHCTHPLLSRHCSHHRLPPQPSPHSTPPHHLPRPTPPPHLTTNVNLRGPLRGTALGVEDHGGYYDDADADGYYDDDGGYGYDQHDGGGGGGGFQHEERAAPLPIPDAGPARFSFCPPRHRMPLNSRDEASNCVSRRSASARPYTEVPPEWSPAELERVGRGARPRRQILPVARRVIYHASHPHSVP